MLFFFWRRFSKAVYAFAMLEAWSVLRMHSGQYLGRPAGTKQCSVPEAALTTEPFWAKFSWVTVLEKQ